MKDKLATAEPLSLVAQAVLRQASWKLLAAGLGTTSRDVSWVEATPSFGKILAQFQLAGGAVTYPGAGFLASTGAGMPPWLRAHGAAASAAARAAAGVARSGQVAATDPGSAAVRKAEQFLGDRYVWGGHGPGGFDCTGFTWYVYKQAGVALPVHDLAGQLAAGRPVARDQIGPGDLVFFQNTYKPGLSHVGIALGDGRFIHAASEEYGVTISRLDESYWSQRYYAASRPGSTGGQS